MAASLLATSRGGITCSIEEILGKFKRLLDVKNFCLQDLESSDMAWTSKTYWGGSAATFAVFSWAIVPSNQSYEDCE